MENMLCKNRRNFHSCEGSCSDFAFSRKWCQTAFLQFAYHARKICGVSRGLSPLVVVSKGGIAALVGCRHRTGGFCVLQDEKPRSMPKAESACSVVGGAAQWKGAAKRSLGMERHHRGSQRDIKPAAASLLLK